MLLICLGAGARPPIAVLREARRRGIPIVVIAGQGDRPTAAPAEAAALVDRVCAGSAEQFEEWRLRGVGSVSLGAEYDRADGHAETVHSLESFFAGLPARERQRFRWRRKTRLISDTSIGKRVAARHAHRRIPDWEALRARLGSPQTILCLGNGPTSEEVAVRNVPHDCLMRVNHRWVDRGVLDRPDMVFVGSLRTTLEVGANCVFGFRRISKEREVFVRHLLVGLRLDTLEHFTLERAESILQDDTWRANPTNGAVMIVTAAMLRPRRIVIAGMDLFADDRGAYPGDLTSENDYMSGHDRNVDVDVIASALEGFDGEVTILSPNLERALGQHGGDFPLVRGDAREGIPER